ncbi:MAG: 16S rRNA (guanine(966)-N(2))-methyltransferase RsmD [Spirochaetota bacterium]|nr:MAG: 16S rRNA (guanine(966)-N(2))-methyltransferase RsmD [Spirochaetota bacterium]
MGKYLKLTGGSYKGRRLYVPKTGTRPATNRVREAVFNVVYNFFNQGVKGLDVLDLFAGSGSLGLEALSRGAASCTFVDNDPNAVRSIRKNIELLSLKGEVISTTAHAYLKAKKALHFELIFMDPPYNYTACAEVVRLLREAIDGKLSPVLIYERSYKERIPDFGNNVLLLKRKRYGQTELLYYRIEK